MRNEGKKGRCGSVSGWCSEQRNGFTTPERRKFRRVHGLQFPLHPQQVTGWIVILIIVINTFAVLTPHLEPNSRSTLTLVIAAIFLTHISSHLVVLLMDPADPRIRSQPTNKILPEFDRGKHSHVIENGRCHLCNITTDSRRTKHCSICNKCIVRFDHHCKWLNNCIGARNYSAFLVCLISAILANLFVAGLSATELSFCLIPDRFANHLGANEASGANGTAEDTTTALIAPVSDIATIVAMFAIGVLSVVAAILLLHLCFFHGYIACLGLTTYEYVRKKREKNSGRPTGDGVDPRSDPTAIHEHASARCVALSLRKSATKAIRSSRPYPANEWVTRNARLCLSVPRWCSNVESNRDQSTNSNVSVGLPTSSANLRPCPPVQLVHDAMHCCSMFGTLARSKKRSRKRSNGEGAADTTDSVRVSTNTCATVQRMSSVSVESAGQFADPAPIRTTDRGIWDSVLGSPRYVVAPMVDASELAWRLLSRRHGAHLCYTPMLHSSVFCRDPKYRRDALASTSEDRPLIVQFCGNEPSNLLEAALLAEPYCDAVDINIGCPQAIAKRGRYGAFLQDDWDLLRRIVTTLSKGLRVPVTCKLRVFPEIEKTVEYARMLEAAGARLLTVHGRTREQKGPLTGVASWDHIKAVRQAVAIPVFANGNVQCLQDVEKCIEETGVDGVMSAEGNLYNPYIFEARHPPSWEPALEYLDLVECHPAPASYIRGHLFKLFHHTLCLAENKEERENLAKNSTMESFKSVVYALRDRYLPFHEGRLIWQGEAADYNLKLPPWLCQAYVRQPPEAHVQKLLVEKIERQNETAKRKFTDEEGNEISRKRLKKLRRIARRPNRPAVAVKRGSDLCWNCPNPVGLKCVHKLCRQCCRNKCFTENLDCAGHRNLTRTRRQMAIEFAAKRRTVQESI